MFSKCTCGNTTFNTDADLIKAKGKPYAAVYCKSEKEAEEMAIRLNEGEK